MTELKITPIDQWKAMSSGELVELPPFRTGEQLVARLRRPSMMDMAASGKIPNTLLRSANSLFGDKFKEELSENDDAMKDAFDLINILADSIFAEPTWSELKDAGIRLTDEQYMFIFNYTQVGNQKLEPFREEQGNTQPDSNGDNVSV